MHVVISWDIKADQPQWKEIDTELRGCFERFSWARPLSTFYVVKLRSVEDRAAIKERLLAVVQRTSAKVHFIVSPAIAGGRYAGWLPKSMWEKLNQRSDP